MPLQKIYSMRVLFLFISLFSFATLGFGQNETIGFNFKCCTLEAEIYPIEPVLCEGGVVTLSAFNYGGIAPFTYRWLNENWSEEKTEQDIEVGLGSYILVITDAEGCESTEIVEVKIDPNIELTISPDEPIICAGKATTLSVDAFEEVSAFQWTTENGTIESGANEATVTINSPGLYTIVATFEDGCIQSASKEVGAFDLPELQIISSLGGAPVCLGQTVTLSASGGSNYLWSTDEIGTSIVVTPLETTTYTVQEYTNDACLVETSIEIEVREATAPEIMVENGNTTVCAGEEVRLFVNDSGTYQWSGGTNGTSTESFYVVNPTETSTYTLIYQDLNNCEAIAEQTIEVHETGTVEIQTESEEVECAYPVVLYVEAEDGRTYEWTSGTPENLELLPEENRINALATDEFKVTITDENGCEYEDELVLEENPVAASVKEKLESKGFYGIPISLELPAFRANARNNSVDCDAILPPTQVCAEDGNACVYQDVEGISIELGGSTINDIKQLVKDNLLFFQHEQLQYDDSKAFITTNESLCCPAFCAIIEEQFEGAELAYWIHLWEAPEGGQDMLYILANIPDEEVHSPAVANLEGFLNETLETRKNEPLITDFSNKAEELIFTTQNILLANFTNTKKGKSTDDCFILKEDVICIAPSGQPIPIKKGSRLEFFAAKDGGSNFDARALVNFVEKDNTGQEIRYRAFHYKTDSETHQGYRPTYAKRNYPFTDLRIPASSEVEVLLGEVAEDDANESCEVDYLISKWTWTNDYPFEEYSKGPHIADFTPQVIDYYSTAFAACLPNMEGHEFEQAEENARYNPFGRKGFLFKVQKGVQFAYIYGFEDANQPDIIHYLFWDNGLCRWRTYPGITEDERTTMHFLDALIETFKQVFTESGHDILDVVGMVPLLGELADGINGVWYLAEGDEANAALSFIALAPLVGSSATGGRLILKIKNGTKTISKTVKANSRFIGKVICPLGGRSNQGCSVVSMTKIIEEVVKNDFFDDEYAKLLKELFDNDDFFKAFNNNPELVKPWIFLYRGLSTNGPILRKNQELLKNLLSLSKKYENVNWIKLINNAERFGVERLLQRLKKLEDIDGLDKVLISLSGFENQVQGARFVIKYADQLYDQAGIIVKKFEANNFNTSGLRLYDIVISKNGVDISMELKHWQNWRATDFRNQFFKDLQNMTSLGEIQWKFQRTGLVGNLEDLKLNVFNSLATRNPNGIWQPRGDFKDLVAGNLAKFKILFGNGIKDASDVMIIMNNNIEFQKIFEVIN